MKENKYDNDKFFNQYSQMSRSVYGLKGAGEEVREAESAYLAELDTLARRTDSMDLVMFPVDPRLGEDYMLGAKQFIDRFRVGTFVPMHFDDVYDKANAFREYAGERGVRFVSLEYKGEDFMI